MSFDIERRKNKESSGPRIGKPEQSQKARINNYEQDLAERIPGARKQPASGALLGSKGDIKTENFLLDSKKTDKNIINVSAKDLGKICKEARGESKQPALVLTLETAYTCPNEWVCIPLDLFCKMLELNMDKGINNDD